MSSTASSVTLLKTLAVRSAEITHPTGDPSFSVLQAFPAGFTAEEADPALMLDHFGPMISTGIEKDPDVFPIGWHPHRGQALVRFFHPFFPAL